MQQRFEYQEGIHRSKGSTTFIINGRTPPSYDISVNERGKPGYSKGIELQILRVQPLTS